MSLKIPKVIHMIWIGPDECPYEESIDSYKRNNPYHSSSCFSGNILLAMEKKEVSLWFLENSKTK